MNDSLNYTIREMRHDDIPTAVAFYNELAEAEQLVGPTTVADYSVQFGMATAQYETRLLAHLTKADGSEGKLVGYSLIAKGDSDTTAQMLLHVLPAYRKRGIGSAVLARLEQHARNKGATRMIVESDERATLRVRLLQQHGWYIDHATLTMQLPSDYSQPEPRIPEGCVIRNFVAGQDEDTLIQVAIAAFAGFADFYASDAEREAEMTKHEWFDPASIFFICVGDAQGEVVGFCTTSVNEDGTEGWIRMMGVIEGHRRAGLGRALLLSGIAYLRPRTPLILLGAEDYNTKAIALYESVGFTVKNKGIALFKDLR